ncbi:hypothetical protein ACPTGO_30980, partial [Pseudomonas aeruginosa]
RAAPLLVLRGGGGGGGARGAPPPPPPEMEPIDNDDTPRVVIAGVGRMGQNVARVLRAQRVPFNAQDTSVVYNELTRSHGALP